MTADDEILLFLDLVVDVSVRACGHKGRSGANHLHDARLLDGLSLADVGRVLIRTGQEGFSLLPAALAALWRVLEGFFGVEALFSC